MRVLVADDTATSRFLLEEAVKRAGHECVAVEDGKLAWQHLSRRGADVLVSDWLMPGMDGIELCKKVRAELDGPYLYIIMLTALEEKSHVVEAMEAGVDDYLTKPVDPDDLRIRLIAGERVARLHRRLHDQQAELRALNEKLYEDARRDPLTAVGNRLRLREDLEHMQGRAERYGHSHAIALFDIDHFKAFNDSAGHLAGDEVLRSVAATLEGECRRGDAIYRYGGEELLVILPEQDVETASLAAERMRAAVEALGIDHPSAPEPGAVTVSVGVAAVEDAERGDAEYWQLIRRADEALYRAKSSGRNRVEAG